MLSKSSAAVAERFGEDQDDDDATAVEESTRKRKCAVIGVSPNKRANSVKGVK